MHKLQRSATPACLADYRHGQHAWSDVEPEHKQEIWQRLEEMQGRRCAYCEAPIESGKRHIEHFKQLLPVFEDALNSIADRPFVTAIKHTLQP